MIAVVPSAALHGIEAGRVDVEVDVSSGLPAYHVIGMAATSVKEGARRIRSALRNCGQDVPARRITVNLAPADLRKEGASFDLAIAVGVVVASGAFCADALKGLVIVGELGLDGTIRRVRGALAAACLVREMGLRGIVVPRECAAEAAAVPGVEVFAVGHLSEVLGALDGKVSLEPCVDNAEQVGVRGNSEGDDFADVRGQNIARRAAEIAVAGGHNLLLYGPPGVGKTMIALRLPTIMPLLSHDEAIEVTKIYSAAGISPKGGLITRRPFRAPHHSTSAAGLVGGGPQPRPGELSLAHRGVLFLDELPEFGRIAVEVLRQPLEEQVVRLGRARGMVRMPAAFHLVASANPCPCGWYGSYERACTCSLGAIERYRARLSGPLLDRIDLQVRVDTVDLTEIRAAENGESSESIRARVEEARARQLDRLRGCGARLNGEMSVQATRTTCELTASAEKALARLFGRRPGITARGIDRIIRVARTIADMEGAATIDAGAILEASAYRAVDMDAVARSFELPAPSPSA